ncbi:hypothetical protein [Lottiidibacillus patelloidae]|nr:hypothetical protein [Lottiidibacillus patelloidae]
MITVACSINDTNVEEQFMKLVPFPKSINILHIDDYKGGKVILYIFQ